VELQYEQQQDESITNMKLQYEQQLDEQQLDEL
jgi:hypothetical protein